MKALVLILALAASAIAADRVTVSVGAFYWEGAWFKDATATLLNSDGVRISEKVTVPSRALMRGGSIPGSRKPVTLSWAETPQNIRAKLAQAREPMLRDEMLRNAKRDEEAARTAAGFEWVRGTILNRSERGFLVSDRAGLIVHVVGKTDKADGEAWSAQCKRDGLYEYTTVLGAKSTVKNYVAP